MLDLDDLLLKAFELNSQQHENFSADRQKELDILWLAIIEQQQNSYLNQLSNLTPKQRWDFGFEILSQANEILPFDLLENNIPDIPSIHSNALDTEYVNLLLNEFQTAKYEYGFTLNEMGEFAELLALNAELTVEQALNVVKFAVNIGRYNFFKSCDDFYQWQNYIDKVIKTKGKNEPNNFTLA